MLAIEVTYLDGEKELAHERGHVHIDDIIDNIDKLQNTKLVIIHVSQKYHSVGRIIDVLYEKIPPSLHRNILVALKSFGASEELTSLERFVEEIGWGWGKLTP
jgi:hypothetical protein